MGTERNDFIPTDVSGAAPQPATLIVFGLDQNSKPHASWFSEADGPLAEKAAGMMGMKILRLTTDEQQRLAGKLPQGRVFESGRAFVPFVNRTLYGQLEAMGGETPPPPVPADTQAAPTEELTGDGQTMGQLTDTAQNPTAPSTWADIKVGSVVLATEGHMEGWFEAVVIEAKPNNMFMLKWRDWFEEPAFPRKRGHLGLLPADEAAAKAAK
jgi:hypothetical protein